MKIYKAKSGIFDERVWYEHCEMENICLDALRSVDLLPNSPSPIRIDRFLKKKFGVDAEYKDLSNGVLGFTEFGDKGVERIVIAESLDLDSSISSERRINTTMAHEAGHGLFHSHLFVFKGHSLFDELKENPKVMCRDELRNVFNGNNYNNEWWEYQANVAIGALLLPLPLAEEALKPFTIDSGLLLKTLNDNEFDNAVKSLSETFDVNPAVARIRIREIFPKTNQQSL